MTTRITPETQLYLIQSQSAPITLIAFGGYALVSALLGLSAQHKDFGSLNSGLLALAVLAGILNAALTLFVFPWLFTRISRAYGAPSETNEVRAITALSLMPFLLAMLLSILLGLAGPLAVVGSLLALLVFVHGLALANGSTHSSALTHTLAVFVTLLLLMTGVSLITALIASAL